MKIRTYIKTENPTLWQGLCQIKSELLQVNTVTERTQTFFSCSLRFQFTFLKTQHLAAFAGQFHGMGHDDQG